MSTLKTTNLQNASAASPAIVLAADGSATANLSSVNGGPIAGTRNRVINGDMRIDQRNAGASVTNSTSNVYTVDRWYSYGSLSSKFTAQRSTTAPSGFSHSALITSSSAYTVGANEEFDFAQYVEGFNAVDLGFGTASAKSITVSFWVRSSLTGTFGGAINNYNSTRSYPFSYTISVANTFEYKTIAIAGDTSGTWNTDNTIGLNLSFSLGAGSTKSGTAGSWSGSNFLQPTGATSVVGTSGATFYITGVQLEPGTVATPFERRSYGQELSLCQRYFAKTYDTGTVPGTATSAGAISTNVNGTWTYAPSGTWCFPVAMRTQPTITLYSTVNANTTGVSSADSTDGAATTISLGTSSVAIRRNNNSLGVSSGADMKSQATATAEL